MKVRAFVGPIELELCCAFTAPARRLSGVYFASYDGEHLQRIATSGGSALLLDHRRDPDGGDAAYVECWKPLTRIEGALIGLIALCDGAGSAFDRGTACASCSTVARLSGVAASRPVPEHTLQ